MTEPTPMDAPTWTYDEFARLPSDGSRYEVIGGQVQVTPAPSPAHQVVLLRLSTALREFAERERLGVVLPRVDLLFVEGTFLCPDLLFVPNPRRDGITSRGVESTPGLVVEIVSPSSGALDRVVKPRRYREFGVPEYWVVDPNEKIIQRWDFAAGAAAAKRIDERLEWRPTGASKALVIDLRRLFRAM